MQRCREIRAKRYICPICNKPLNLETAKTDDEGSAVHEDCYINKISGLIPPKPRRNNAPASEKANAKPLPPR